MDEVVYGDIHWDGRTLTAGGRVLGPGRYRYGGPSGPVLEVAPDGPPDDGPDDQDE